MTDKLPSLDRNDPKLIIDALKEYGCRGKLSDLQSVLGLLKHPNDEVKNAATKAASNLIKENLISYYNDLTNDVRSKLGLLLQSLDPRIIDEISVDLFGESNERRLRAIQILGLLKKNPRIREILVNLIKDRNEKVRATAIGLLGKVVGPNDQDLILSLLNDPDKRVRANTVEALESLGNKRLIPILLRFRKDGNNRIRGNIIKALFNLGFTDIEPDLIEMINTPNDLMKASALWVISQIGHASPHIEDAAGRAFLSENEMVIRNAKNALNKLGTPRALGYLRYLEMAAAKTGEGTE
ncbi:MAG: HEAT repeat domain-containing protein [Chitinispirillaceae bacterium]|nr:HEAT repeat domain-containing protein [Chitinispirillaceae bacterium]